MPRPREVLPVTVEARVSASQPRLALRKPEAAAALGMSVDSFERYVLPEIRVVRQGSLVLVPVVELERWLERAAARTIETAS
jgi:hypothetical protein